MLGESIKEFLTFYYQKQKLLLLLVNENLGIANSTQSSLK